MWRGTLCSTLLHGGILVAIFVGIPILPKIFDREIETGASEQSISVEIVSADSVDLRQNVIAPDKLPTRDTPAAGVTGALRPLAIEKAETEQAETTQTETPVQPAARSDKTRIPEGELNRPRPERTVSKPPQAVSRRQPDSPRQAQTPRKPQPPGPKTANNRPETANNKTLRKQEIARVDSANSPTPASDAVKPSTAKPPTAKSTTAKPPAEKSSAAKPPTQKASIAKPQAEKKSAENSSAAKSSAAKDATEAAAALQKTKAQEARPREQASTAKKRAAKQNAARQSRAGGRASAGGDEFIQAVRGEKRELVEQVLESDTRLRQAIAPRPDDIKVPEQARIRTLERFRKSASAGFPHAQYNLAGKYLRGEDLPKDASEALKWLTRAAQQGYVPAQTLLGMLRFTGLGVPQDQAEAAFWWSLAADAGDDGAKIGTELIQKLLKPRELVKSKRLRARWGSLITDLADLNTGNTNRRDLDDRLREASEQGDFDAVLSLLASGADADEAGDEGRNAVINAAWRGRGRIIQLLLERGVATELSDDGGRTPLLWGAINGHTDIVRKLVEGGANPNHTDSDGGTALIRAAWNGHTGIVRDLIAAGADVNMRDRNGLTALAHARRERNSAIVNALNAAGAR